MNYILITTSKYFNSNSISLTRFLASRNAILFPYSIKPGFEDGKSALLKGMNAVCPEVTFNVCPALSYKFQTISTKQCKVKFQTTLNGFFAAIYPKSFGRNFEFKLIN